MKSLKHSGSQSATTRVVAKPTIETPEFAAKQVPKKRVVAVHRTTAVYLDRGQDNGQGQFEDVGHQRSEHNPDYAHARVGDPHEDGFDRLQAIFDKQGPRFSQRARSPLVQFLNRVGLRMPPEIYWPWPAMYLFLTPIMFVWVLGVLKVDDWSKGIDDITYYIGDGYLRSAAQFKVSVRDSLVLGAIAATAAWLFAAHQRRRLGLPRTWRQFIADDRTGTRQR